LIQTQTQTQIQEALELSKKDVFSIYEEKTNQKLWVKKAKSSGSNLLQRIIYGIFKNPLLLPSENQTPSQSIIYEVQRLEEIFKKFSYVPEVLISNENFMVIVDSGKDLRKIMKKIKDSLEAEKIIYQALDVLIEFHALGFFHGGSQIKNFTMKEDKISMIDFEEKFVGVDIEELQFRDLFLFLISIARLEYDINLQEIIDIYIDKSSKKIFAEKFLRLIESSKIMINLMGNKYIYNLVGKDAQSVYKLFKQLS